MLNNAAHSQNNSGQCLNDAIYVQIGQKSRRDDISVANNPNYDGRESRRDDILKMKILHAIPPGFLLISDCFATDMSSRWDFPSHIRNLKIQ
jgi:hypothetical protein